MRNRKLLNDQGGFTLIEIIAVLVILGILAAVAVPKFFDLQTKAREKAIASAMSEVKVRVNQYFALKLLEGQTWNGIWTGGTVYSDIGTNLGSDFTGITYVLSGSPPDKQTGTLAVTGSYVVAGGTPIPINETIDLPRYQ